MNLDAVLKPYEDSQPNNLTMQNNIIQRIPMIIDPHTGQVTQEFQSFYDAIVRCITNDLWEELYLISDHVISYSEFENYIGVAKVQWDSVYMLSKPEGRGLDIELNIQRFQNIHRNILGGFFVIFYALEETKSAMLGDKITHLHKYRTELLFTYKDGGFQIITHFKQFELVEDE